MNFPRLALRLVSWYVIIGFRHVCISIYSFNTMNRDCPRALQLHSTLHFFLVALHQSVCRSFKNMNTTWSIDSGGMVLDYWSYDVLHAWFKHCGDCQCLSNVRWSVSYINSFILLFSRVKQLTIASYTASAYLVPRKHRARVHTSSFTYQMLSLMRS